MHLITTLKSTATLTIFITANILILNCNATEPVTASPSTDQASYTLLDAKGKIVTANARCARTQASDLIWELKTDDSSVHDKDNVYRWGGKGAEKVGTIFFDDWNSLLNATNTEKLCGFDDWRVPTIDELKTLATNTAAKPTINPEIFQLTLQAPYWSVSTYQNYPEHAQTVDFATGASNYYNGFRGDRLPLRLVRSNKK
jgi:hypothetical protein